MGRAAYFIRLYGCPQKCSWCDSAGTWHPDYRPTSIQMLTPSELAELVKQNSNPDAVVVLTGGEPIMFDLYPLTDALHELGREIHLETSGIRELRGNIDWLTLSPKPFGTPPRRSVVRAAHEAKIIVAKPEDITLGLASLEALNPQAEIWLHPEWSRARDKDMAVLNAITHAVKEDPRLRAGYQIHKAYQADNLSPTSLKTLIPLGGNPQNGY